MSSDKNKESFLDQVEQILQGVKQDKEKVKREEKGGGGGGRRGEEERKV